MIFSKKKEEKKEPETVKLTIPTTPTLQYFPQFTIHQEIQRKINFIAAQKGVDYNEIIREILYNSLGYHYEPVNN